MRALQNRNLASDVEVVEVGTAGLGLLDLIDGFDRLILVDAIVTGAEPGTIHELRGDDIASTAHLGAGHDADLPTVIALGRKLAGDRMPGEVVAIAVEAADVERISMSLSSKVEAAVAVAAARIEELCSSEDAVGG